MSEFIKHNQGLIPVEIAAPTSDFDWRTEAWLSGSQHPINRLAEKTEWIKKTGYGYQITPFVFQDEAAELAQGAHIFVPEGRYNNTVLITGENYRLRTRILEGAGWIEAKNPSGQIFQEWLGSTQDKNKVFEFLQGWMVRFVVAKGYGILAMEVIDLPQYQKEWEKVIPEGDDEVFWQPQPAYFPSGRW